MQIDEEKVRAAIARMGEQFKAFADAFRAAFDKLLASIKVAMERMMPFLREMREYIRKYHILYRVDVMSVWIPWTRGHFRPRLRVRFN